MGVISTGNGEVWGASNRFIYAMLLHFSKISGEKEYVKCMISSFDLGYNSFRLNSISDDDLSDFEKLIINYIKDGAYSKVFNMEYRDPAIENSLNDLVRIIKLEISRRSINNR